MLVATVAIFAFAEATRTARFINVGLLLGLILLPRLLLCGMLTAGLNDLIIGALVIALGMPPGQIKNMYGDWRFERLEQWRPILH